MKEDTPSLFVDSQFGKNMKTSITLFSMLAIGLIVATKFQSEKPKAILVKPNLTIPTAQNVKADPILIKPNRPSLNWQERLVKGVMSFESFRSKPYLCPAGVLTVGYGHTGKYANCTMSQARAERLLREEIEEAKQIVLRNVRVQLTENQLASLTSFTFNCGEGNLLKLVNGSNRLNAGNYKSIERVMPLYVYGDGKKLRGLEIRRGWELNLWKGIFTI
jgi:lysozyme